MLSKRKRPHKGQSKDLSLDIRRVRAGLMIHGHTLQSYARQAGVTRPLIVQIIKGDRPAKSGKSAIIRRQLEEIAA